MTTTTTEKVQMIEVESKNLKAIGYDAKESKLYIRFHDGNRLYCYRRVPAVVWVGLQAAKSKGQYFEEQIRFFFTYEEVNAVDAVLTPPTQGGNPVAGF